MRKAELEKLYYRREKEDMRSKYIVKCLCQIPLLPIDRIDEGVRVILQLVEETFSGDVKNKNRWKHFIKSYFQKQWGKTVKKKVFCVFNETDRTNNFSETNNHLTATLISEKPTPYEFLRKFMFLI